MMLYRKFLFYKQKSLLVCLNSCLSRLQLSHQLALITQPTYPPILDVSKEGKLKHERELFYDSVKALPTVEQKLYAIARNKSHRESSYLISAIPPTLVGIPFQHYITRTHMINGLPDKLSTINVDEEFTSLKDSFCEVLATHYFNPWEEDKTKKLSDYLSEKQCGSKLVRGLVSECYKKLAIQNDYLVQSTLQNKPYVRSYWWHGGFKSKKEFDKQFISDRNFVFNFRDYPDFSIRMSKPLPPILPLDDALCATSEVKNYNYKPHCLGIRGIRFVDLACSPGFWPGDPHEFPLLQVYTADRMANLLSKLKYYDLQYIEDGVGVMASFAWLNVFATYLGFTPYHDLIYPLVGHTIITNGQDWTFYTYQLNTVSFHEDLDKKDRRNICWSSGKMRLFDTVEDGQVKGINDEVFMMLLKLLRYEPEVNSNIELKPYLGEDTRSEEEILATRKLLRKAFKSFKTHWLFKKEVPLWQKIYKFHKDAPPSPQIRME